MIVIIQNLRISQSEEGLDLDRIQKSINHLNLIKVSKVTERGLRVILGIDIVIMKEVIKKHIKNIKMVLGCHLKVTSLKIIVQGVTVQIWESMVRRRDSKKKMND